MHEENALLFLILYSGPCISPRYLALDQALFSNRILDRIVTEIIHHPFFIVPSFDELDCSQKTVDNDLSKKVKSDDFTYPLHRSEVGEEDGG